MTMGNVYCPMGDVGWGIEMDGGSKLGVQLVL